MTDKEKQLAKKIAENFRKAMKKNGVKTKPFPIKMQASDIIFEANGIKSVVVLKGSCQNDLNRTS